MEKRVPGTEAPHPLWPCSSSSASPTASSPSDVITELRTYVSRDAVRAGETFKAAVRLGDRARMAHQRQSRKRRIPHPHEPGILRTTPLPFQVLDIVYPEALMVRLGFSASRCRRLFRKRPDRRARQSRRFPETRHLQTQGDGRVAGLQRRLLPAAGKPRTSR